MSTPLHTTKAVAERFGVSVWTVTRAAREHECYALKLPSKTGGYLFHDEHIEQLAAYLNREVAA